MKGRVDAHGHPVRVFVGNLLVHVEEISVLGTNGLFTVAGDSVPEVQVHRLSGGAHSIALVAPGLGGAAGHVARNQIAEAWVAPLQVVISLFFWDISG